MKSVQPGASNQGVVAVAAAQPIVPGIADHYVVEAVAEAAAPSADQGQVLDILGKVGVVGCGQDSVGALAGLFRNSVEASQVVGDTIDVIAQAADHEVGAGAAINDVVARPACDVVVAAIAGQRLAAV